MWLTIIEWAGCGINSRPGVIKFWETPEIWDPMRLRTLGPQYNYDFGDPSIEMGSDRIAIFDCMQSSIYKQRNTRL